MAARASALWEGQRHLAHACEHANLTRFEAEAARLAADRHPYRAIALALSLPETQTRALVAAAAEALKRAHPHLVRAQARALRDLYQCMRNRRSSRPAPLYTYAPIAGGYSSRPVTLRPRPEGELPEDLLACPLRFLVELARQLRPRLPRAA